MGILVVDGVIDRRRLHVERQIKEPSAVGPCRAEFGRGGDGHFGGVVGFETPHSIFLQVGDRDARRLDVEQVGCERIDVAFRYPRCPEIGVDVTGQHIFGLHASQGFRVAGIRRASLSSSREFGSDVAGQIRIGGLPAFRFGVMKNQVAQFANDLRFWLAVECGDVRQVHCPTLVQGDEQSFFGVFHLGDGRRLADDI